MQQLSFYSYSMVTSLICYDLPFKDPPCCEENKSFTKLLQRWRHLLTGSFIPQVSLHQKGYHSPGGT